MSQWKHVRYRRGGRLALQKLNGVKSDEGASREQRGSAGENRQQHHKDSKARICKETLESRNKLLNVSRSEGEFEELSNSPQI